DQCPRSWFTDATLVYFVRSNCAAACAPAWHPAQYFCTNGRTVSENSRSGSACGAARSPSASIALTTIPIRDILSPESTSYYRRFQLALLIAQPRNSVQTSPPPASIRGTARSTP